MAKPKLVIVGGVAAGASAAAKARRCNEDAEILLLEKGPHISYATCGLPYYLSGVIKKRDKLLVTTPESFKKRFNVEVRTGQEVIKIERTDQKVLVKDIATGSITEESYDRLILATGADAIIPPLPGVNLPFVFTLKTLEDTDRIFDYMKKKKPAKAVVIGGGLIGMEAVDNFGRKGMDVSVVEFYPQILPFLDREMAEPVRLHAEGKGVKFYLSEKAAAIEETGQGAILRTSEGRELPADLVILSVGIRPNVRLAKDAGVAIGRSGGIVVDEYMGTNDPRILAAGDCIEAVNVVTGKPTLVPMGSAANKQGRAAGANAMGRRIAVKGFTGTVIVKVFDLAVAKTGLSEREAGENGLSTLVTYIHPGDHADYYPDAQSLNMKTIVERASGRLLGAQILGKQGVDKRIDIMATAIYNRMNVEELLQLDLAYAPPYSSARDPIVVVGAVAQNFYAKDWNPITPAELHDRIARGDNLAIVDVRTKKELEKTGTIRGAVHIPIDDLRARLAELDPNKETVLYCAVGQRSYIGSRILAQRGFRNVKTLTGSMESWIYETVPNKKL